MPDHFHAQAHSEAEMETFRTRYDQMCFVYPELERIAEYTTDLIDNAGECGDFEQAYRYHVLARTYGGLSDNAKNIVRQGALNPTDRAPLYRTEPQFGPLWQAAAQHAADRIAEEGPRDFLIDVDPCTQGDACEYRPGAWVITQFDDLSTDSSARFAAWEWREAWACFREQSEEWADASDEQYSASLPEDDNPGCHQGSHDQTCTWVDEFAGDQGSDRATVDSIWHEAPAPNPHEGFAFTVHDNAGQSIRFNLHFDPAADPIGDVDDVPTEDPTGRTISSHNRPSGARCRWSGTPVTSAYGLPGCMDRCPESTIIESEGK